MCTLCMLIDSSNEIKLKRNENSSLSMSKLIVGLSLYGIFKRHVARNKHVICT